MVTTLRAACELKNKVRTALFAAVLLTYVPAFAQEHAPAPATTPAAAPADQHAPAAAQPAGEHAPAQGEHAEEAEHHDESIGGMILAMGWPVANFAIFLYVLYRFGNKPFKEYLAGRSSSIRKDLVDAAELRSTATAQLATIEQKLQALPGELAALRTRGAEEIKAEEQRIATQAAADRDRLLDQTRREIDLQVRLAKKDILEHAANLSVGLATDRIKKEVTPADQDRLVDRYLQQVKEN
jgi:F-type H+-transporting ATPase subunit b